MVCLGLKPRAAGWKGQTNPLSCGCTCLISIPFSCLPMMPSMNYLPFPYFCLPHT